MTIDAYDVGDVVTLAATFTDPDGTAADPTTVTVSIQEPDGTESTPAAVQDSTGVYHYDLTLSASGRWRARIAGTGAIVAAAEWNGYVRESVFA